MSVWRYITHIDGTTLDHLVKSSGHSEAEVLAELERLQEKKKVALWTPDDGSEMRWWRYDQRPLSEHTLTVALRLALYNGNSDASLRRIMELGAKRGWPEGFREYMAIGTRCKDVRTYAQGMVRLYRSIHFSAADLEHGAQVEMPSAT